MKIIITSMDIEQLLDIDNFLVNEGYEISSAESSSNPVGLNFGVPEIILLLEGIQKVLEIFFKIREFIQHSDKLQSNINNIQKRKQVTFIINDDNSQAVLNTSMNDDEIQGIIQQFFNKK